MLLALQEAVAWTATGTGILLDRDELEFPFGIRERQVISDGLLLVPHRDDEFGILREFLDDVRDDRFVVDRQYGFVDMLCDFPHLGSDTCGKNTYLVFHINLYACSPFAAAFLQGHVGRIERDEELLKDVEACFGDRAVAADGLRHEIGFLLRRIQRVRGSDAVRDLIENRRIENAVAHVDGLLKVEAALLHPLHALDSAYAIELEFHVVGDALFRYLESFPVAGHDMDIQVGLKEKESVMVVRTECLHRLAFRGVVKPPVGEDPIYVEDEVLRLPYALRCHRNILRLKVVRGKADVRRESFDLRIL